MLSVAESINRKIFQRNLKRMEKNSYARPPLWTESICGGLDICILLLKSSSCIMPLGAILSNFQVVNYRPQCYNMIQYKKQIVEKQCKKGMLYI